KHSENSFSNNAAIHFAFTLHSVGKNNRHFDNFHSFFVRSEFHLYLKTVTFQFYFMKPDFLESFPRKTNKTCRSIIHRNSQNKPDITRGEIRKQHPSHRPVYDIYAIAIPGTHTHSAFFAGFKKFGKVFWVV